MKEIAEILTRLANHPYKDENIFFKSVSEIPEDIRGLISEIEFLSAGGVHIRLYDKRKAQKLLDEYF